MRYCDKTQIIYNSSSAKYMQKVKLKDNRLIPSCREHKRDQSERQQRKRHNSSERNIRSKGKNLSLSFYNQETLEGSKKIMLDLLPIQSVTTEYYKVCVRQSPHQKVNVPIKAKLNKDNKKTQDLKNNSHQRHNKLNKNQSGGSFSHKKSTSETKKQSKITKISRSHQKDRALQTRLENMNIQRQNAYLQKYFGGYLKKLNPTR